MPSSLQLLFQSLLRRSSILIVSLLGIAALSQEASAMSFRCNSYLIEVGMQKLELSQKCGAPASASSRIERRITRVKQRAAPGVYPRDLQVVEVEQEVEITIEEWIYNFGPNQFMQRVVMEGGRIRKISDLGYGR